MKPLDPEADRKRLLHQPLARRLALLKEICPRYGVEFLGLKDIPNKDINRTAVLKKCHKHGVQEVKLSAFTTHAVFGCGQCGKEKWYEESRKTDEEKKATRKAAYLRGKLSGRYYSAVPKDKLNKPSCFYIMSSACGRFVKVGVTANRPWKRVDAVNALCASHGNDVVFDKIEVFRTTWQKASVIESHVKAAHTDDVQTTLNRFQGSGEILTASRLEVVLTTKRLHGETLLVALLGGDGGGERVCFDEGEIRFEVAHRGIGKREQAKAERDARIVKELDELLYNVGKAVSAFNSYVPEGGETIDPHIEVVMVHKYKSGLSRIKITNLKLSKSIEVSVNEGIRWKDFRLLTTITK